MEPWPLKATIVQEIRGFRRRILGIAGRRKSRARTPFHYFVVKSWKKVETRQKEGDELGNFGRPQLDFSLTISKYSALTVSASNDRLADKLSHSGPTNYHEYRHLISDNAASTSGASVAGNGRSRQGPDLFESRRLCSTYFWISLIVFLCLVMIEKHAVGRATCGRANNQLW